MSCKFVCRDMVEQRFKHLKWRERRPPILPFNSYVLLEKLDPKCLIYYPQFAKFYLLSVENPER